MNQDVLGVAGDLVHKEGPKEIYAAPLADGSRAVLLLNRQYYPETSEPVSVCFLTALGALYNLPECNAFGSHAA